MNARATIALALGLTASFACSGTADAMCDLPAGTQPLPTELREASGAAISGDGTLWVLADSGEPVLFAIDEDNRIAARVRVENTRVQDWEDLASGPCPAGECLFIGEIGDNRHRLAQRAILRIARPAAVDGTITAERFAFRFPGGPSDAEALAALPDGSLLVITKGRNGPVGVFRYPAPLRADSMITLEHVQNLTSGIVQVPQQLTAATSFGADRILIRTYSALQQYRIDGDTLAPVGAPVDLRSIGESQGEGLAAGTDGRVVLVGEAAGNGTIARLRCERVS